VGKKRKRKPQGHPARVARLRAIDGGVKPSKPLAGRPEYEAHMQAWREAGCPVGPAP